MAVTPEQKATLDAVRARRAQAQGGAGTLTPEQQRAIDDVRRRRAAAGPTREKAEAATGGPTIENAEILTPAANTLEDILYSTAGGVPRGAVESLMSPVTLAKLLSQGSDYLGAKGEDLIRSTLGMEPNTTRDAETAERNKHNIFSVTDPVQAEVRQTMDENLYAPRTEPGEYGRTVGEFLAPGSIPTKSALAAPGFAAKAGNWVADLFGNAVVPGIVSEAAGDLTEGSVLEPWARGVGAIGGNLAVAGGRSAVSTEGAIRRAAGDISPEDLVAARGLRDRSQAFGVPLTVPETIAQIQGGASALPQLQRVVEGSISGKNAMGEFFAARPAGVAGAVNTRLLDPIAPQSPNPSTLGPIAAESADSAMRTVERQRSNITEPVYGVADATNVPPDQIQQLLQQIDTRINADQTGIVAPPLTDLRRTLIAEPAVPGTPAQRIPRTTPAGKTIYSNVPATPGAPEVPITNVGQLDIARKNARDAVAFGPGQDAITATQRHEVAPIIEALDDTLEQGSDAFVAAKNLHRDATRQLVEPVEQGPLGKVAAVGGAPVDGTRAAGGAILPAQPLVGGADESADAVTRLLAADAEAGRTGNTAALVRQNLADRFATANTATQQGNQEFSGAKFWRDVAGNDPKNETLGAVLGALGVPNPAPLMETLQATGRRMPIGSATEFNRQVASELGEQSNASRAMTAIKSLGGSIVTQGNDAAKRAFMRRNLSTIGKLFVDPQGIDLLEQILARGGYATGGGAAGRSLGQIGSILSPGPTADDYGPRKRTAQPSR